MRKTIVAAALGATALTAIMPTGVSAQSAQTGKITRHFDIPSGSLIVPDSDRADEVGALAKALGGLRDQLAAAERAKAEQTALIVESIGKGLSGLAEGDLISRVDVELTGPFAKLKADFNNAAEALQATMVQVSHAASSINGGAADIRQA